MKKSKNEKKFFQDVGKKATWSNETGIFIRALNEDKIRISVYDDDTKELIGDN